MESNIENGGRIEGVIGILCRCGEVNVKSDAKYVVCVDGVR